MCVKFIINFKKMPSLINFTSDMNDTKYDCVPIQFLEMRYQNLFSLKCTL